MESLRKNIKTQLEQKAPAIFNVIHSIRNRQYFRRRYSQFHREFREILFPNSASLSIMTGPFQGMKYFDEIVWGSITPKWLGSYEAELHPIIQDIVNCSYDTVIDVGCAEGYYAVGLAKRLPNTKIYAFDTDFISRKQTHRLANLNAVANQVKIGTFCSHKHLDELSQGKTLVIADIEGFEVQLLDPDRAESLLRNDILVEVHETAELQKDSFEVEKLLKLRFSESHDIQRIAADHRDIWISQNSQYLPVTISNDDLIKATEESRTKGQVWLWMQAHGF